jgi:hypothetical protein
MLEQAVEDIGRHAMNLTFAQSGGACIATVQTLIHLMETEASISSCRTVVEADDTYVSQAIHPWLW